MRELSNFFPYIEKIFDINVQFLIINSSTLTAFRENSTFNNHILCDKAAKLQSLVTKLGLASQRTLCSPTFFFFSIKYGFNIKLKITSADSIQLAFTNELKLSYP